MATAKKHGNKYQVLVFDGYYEKDGVKKKKYKTISAATKAEAEYQALQYKMKHSTDRDFTVSEAIEYYINAKQNALSPTTITTYRGIYKHSFKEIANIPLSKLRNVHIQTCIDHLATYNSPKTVRNKYGLFTASVGYCSDYHWKVTLPMCEEPDLVIPTDKDIKLMLSKNKKHWLKVAIYLGAFAPMRRGEIAALEYSDISGNIVTVNKNMVKKGKVWIIKTPKTKSSIRKIDLPDFVIKEIGTGEGRIVNVTPDAITQAWTDLRDSCGLKIRFHDLRHYAVSILHSIGIPDKYIQSRGGWETDKVMKSVYLGTLDDVTVKMNKQANDYFSNTFAVQAKYKHKSRKRRKIGHRKKR